MTRNQKIIAALSIVSVLVIGAGVLTYTLRDNKSDSSLDKNETEQVIQETPNSSILSDVEELVSQEDQTKSVENGEEMVSGVTNSNKPEGNETVDQEQDSVGIDTKYETYTNEFFPEFELVYPSDWEIETRTSNAIFDGLLEREILLSKGSDSFVVELKPLEKINCELNKNYINTNLYNNKYGEYFRDEVRIIEKNVGCEDFENSKLITNINISNSDSYFDVYNESGDKFVKYDLEIYTIYTNSHFLNEMREIINSSTFE